MKKSLLYVGAGALVGVLVLFFSARTRARGSHVRTQQATPSGPGYPRWRAAGSNSASDVVGPVELFTASGKCGYVETWKSGVSEHFVVFLINKTDNDGEPVSSVTRNLVFVNSYESLDAAKHVTEDLCRDR